MRADVGALGCRCRAQRAHESQRVDVGLPRVVHGADGARAERGLERERVVAVERLKGETRGLRLAAAGRERFLRRVHVEDAAALKAGVELLGQPGVELEARQGERADDGARSPLHAAPPGGSGRATAPPPGAA